MKSNQSITINFHSFVDIITNSSTVIYTYVNSVQAVKDFINEVLASIPNLTVNADDLYEFKVVIGDGTAELTAEGILEDGDHEHYEALTAIAEDPKYAQDDEAYNYDLYRSKRSAIKQYVKDNIDPDDVPEDPWGERFDETELVLIPKQAGERRTDLGKLLESVFSHEATRDA